jgi:Sulfotransferase family
MKMTDKWQVKRSFLSRLAGRVHERRDARAPQLDAPSSDHRRASSGAPPIFVIGCQRSGTSLVRRILDSHSRIACPPESHFILPLVETLRNQRALAGLRSMGYVRGEVEASLASFISGFFDGYTAACGKARWADKTPQYVDCLAELWNLFGPDARFIVIVRHGLDVAFSLADAHRHYSAIDPHVARHKGNVALGAASFWLEQSEKIERFRTSQPDACFVLKYEDLTAAPAAALEPMFRWLGEAWEPDVIDYARFDHHEGLEDPDVRRRRRIEPNSDKYLRWPIEIQRSVRETCQPMLTRLGYD